MGELSHDHVIQLATRKFRVLRQSGWCSEDTASYHRVSMGAGIGEVQRCREGGLLLVYGVARTLVLDEHERLATM